MNDCRASHRTSNFVELHLQTIFCCLSHRLDQSQRFLGYIGSFELALPILHLVSRSIMQAIMVAVPRSCNGHGACTSLTESTAGSSVRTSWLFTRGSIS